MALGLGSPIHDPMVFSGLIQFAGALGLLPIIVDDNGLTVVNYYVTSIETWQMSSFFSIKMSRCL